MSRPRRSGPDSPRTVVRHMTRMCASAFVPGAGVEEVAVVVDDEIALRPFVGIGEAPLGQVVEKLEQQRRALTIGSRFHPGNRAGKEVHLSAAARVDRPLPRQRVDAHQGLALRLLVRGKRLRHLALAHRLVRASHAGEHVDTFQAVDSRLHRVRKLGVRPGRIGEQRLALPPRHGLLRIEQGVVRRRPPEALVRVPARAVRVLHGNPAVRSQRRVRQGRRLGPDGRHVGDLDDLRDRVVVVEQVAAIHERVAVSVVLDLRSEQLAEPQQELRLVGNLVHLGQQQQSTPFADRGTERFRLRFERRHRLSCTGERREAHHRAEGGIGEGGELARAVGAIRCGKCRADTFATCGHELAPVHVSAVPQLCAGSSAL